VTVDTVLDSLAPTVEAPLPKTGEVAFVAKTYDGMRRAVAELWLLRPSDPLTLAWIAGQDLITALRELEASKGKPQPS
jgi:hypothetical protein